MLTNGASRTRKAPESATDRGGNKSAAAQKVVIVNGSTDILKLLEAVLEAGHYDVVFVESNEHAYSQIKRVRPHLVILCVRIDDPDSFQVLSMLKLDDETRSIPVVTYASQETPEEPEEDEEESTDQEMFAYKPTVLMN
jgi:PleD family two-component response regulator